MRAKNYNDWKTFSEKISVATPASAEITALIRAWGGGDQTALDRLTPLVYDELRRIAHRQMRNQGGGHPLQTTALVHEAYLHLMDVKGGHWQDRAHFFSASARIMRRILIDLARAHHAKKRGGGVRHIDHSTAFDLDELPSPVSDRSGELLALDEALTLLEKMDGRKARVIELRFFGGLSVEEAAEALKVSPQTVMRDWRLARVWLARELRA